MRRMCFAVPAVGVRLYGRSISASPRTGICGVSSSGAKADAQRHGRAVSPSRFVDCIAGDSPGRFDFWILAWYNKDLQGGSPPDYQRYREEAFS